MTARGCNHHPSLRRLRRHVTTNNGHARRKADDTFSGKGDNNLRLLIRRERKVRVWVLTRVVRRKVTIITSVLARCHVPRAMSTG